MGRPRKFDRQEALYKAVEVFWSRGFEATSMTDLQKALGIGRQSLYNTFGDKDAIYAEALELYIGMGDARTARDLGPEAGLAELRTFLLDTARHLTASDLPGCMMMNTCVERGPHDERAVAMAERGLDTLRTALGRALGNAVQRGEIAAGTDVPATAAMIAGQIAGMAVFARGGASEAELVSTVETVLRLVSGA